MNFVRTSVLLAVMMALFMAVGYLVAKGNGVLVALLVSIGINLFSYWNSDKIILRIYRARKADLHSDHQYCGLVSILAKRAQLPQPCVYIIDNPQPNAFATGRNPQNAAVAATTGLLQSLSYDELAGVISHELAHIQHRDTLIMTLTASFAGAISMLGNVAMLFGHISHNHNTETENDTSTIAETIGMLIAVIVAPIAAMLVQMAISRTREYAADHRGAEICGNPLWLASALKKISSKAKEVLNDEAEHNPATAHLFIINPLNGEGRDHLFSTHPTTENRIAALVKMAEKNETTKQIILSSRPKWMRTKR